MIRIDPKTLRKTVSVLMDTLRILLLEFVKNAKMKTVKHVIEMECVLNVIQFTKFFPIVILIQKKLKKNLEIMLL